MPAALRFQLKLINCLCQAYVFCFLFLTFWFLIISLPEISQGNPDTLRKLKYVTYYIFLNIIGNYLCVWYKSRLSIVKTTHLKREVNFKNKGQISSHEHYEHLPDENFYTSDYSHKEHWLNNTNLNIDRVLSCNNNNNNNSINDVNANNRYKFNSGFEYNNVFDRCNSGMNSSISSRDKNVNLLLETCRSSDSIASAEWSVCKDCDVLTPPRTKHCPVCGHCVLKRDHHCFFTGCCVGLHNQRFFTLFCLYAGVGSLLSTVVSVCYLRLNAELYSTSYLVYFLPVTSLMWVMGLAKGGMVGMVLYLYCNLFTICVCFYFYFVQLFLILRGQTQYEYLKGVRPCHRSVWRNVRLVFGRFWLVGIFIPAPFLGYELDEDLRTFLVNN